MTFRNRESESTVSVDMAAVEICANGHRYPTLAAEVAIERARAPAGLPFGLLGAYQAALVQERNRDVEAAFRAGQYGPAELSPGQQARGLVFFDVPAGALPVPSGATLRVRDESTGDTHVLHLGDTSPCAGD